MTPWILDLNDLELRLAHGTDTRAAGPGYAVVTRERVEVGEPALRLAHLHPRQTYNRFWSDLGQEPLRTASPGIRHHADLAFAHLRDLHERAGRPAEALLAVPGTLSREQLALLLGIAAACPLQATGLVDGAVAAAATVAPAGLCVHLDLDLHRIVITRLDVDVDVVRGPVEAVEEAGLESILDTCAALVAETFVRQARFDPLHGAATEQALYDALPGWLATLVDAPDVHAEVPSSGRPRARLERGAIVERLAPVYARVRARLPAATTTCLVSHRLARLPGLLAALPAALVLPVDATLRGCVLHADRIRSDGRALGHVTRLPAPATPGRPAAPIVPASFAAVPAVPTHLLAGALARALGPDSAALAPDGAAVAESAAALLLRREAGGWRARAAAGHRVAINGSVIDGDADLRAGDVLRIDDGAALTLITVLERDGQAPA